MIRSEEVYKIGQFNKPHGVKGELQLTFTDDVFHRSEARYLVCLMDGILVPFFIESCRMRSSQGALIKLEDVDSQEAAARFTNIEVYFPKSIAEQHPGDEFTWEYFVHFKLHDEQYGLLGEIVEVDQNTSNILFIVDGGDEYGELMIPAVEEFIIEIDAPERILYMDLPEGMLSLDGIDSVEDEEDE